MNKLKIIRFSFVFTLAVLLQACTKDNDLSTQKTDLKVTIENPAELQDVEINNGTITFTEINSGDVTTSNEFTDNELIVTLSEGSYDISFEGEIEYQLDGETQTSAVRGYQTGLVLSGPSAVTSIPLFLHSETTGFVIKEIFFTGTQTPEGDAYHGDKYFIIQNNSDEVLYADGLVIAESLFTTTGKNDYTPDIMDQAFTTEKVLLIPGNGQEYAIEPGESFTIANNAINHIPWNPNSLDLSGAKFELEMLANLDVDNPDVPNLINVFKPMLMHDRGFKSYVIAKLELAPDEFKVQNKYTYEYTRSDIKMSKEAYKIPNEWIIDAVNLSVEAEFQWIVTSPSIDMSWTYVGTVDKDKTRYGKSVIRKVLSTTPDGREILKDTNNSTEDFEAEAKPSLMN